MFLKEKKIRKIHQSFAVFGGFDDNFGKNHEQRGRP